ncbi:hypothetical protein [Microbacterium soli]|uniref:Uncharacterized protein n=1 Tax=Microbacterium soli TaxID=446075 RepID=A0ABP7MK90_9MICO
MRRSMKVILSALALTALTLTACSGETAPSTGGDGPTGEKVSLRMATYTGPSSADNAGYVKWIDRIAELSDGEIEIELFNSGALVNAVDMLPAARDGRADITAPGIIYYPAELPFSHAVGVAFRSANLPAISETFYELARSNELLAGQYEKLGVQQMFTWVPAPTTIGCNKPAVALGDLSNMSIRSGGLLDVALEPIAGNIVALPVDELRDALDRGVVDCYAAVAMDTAADTGLGEVADFIYDPGYGAFGAFDVMMNAQVWNSLSDDHKAVFEQASKEITEQLGDIADVKYAEACTTLQKTSELAVWSDAVQAEWRDASRDAVFDAFVEIGLGAGYSQAEIDGFWEAYDSTLEKHESESDYVPAFERCVAGQL